jgi:hypothetical protein
LSIVRESDFLFYLLQGNKCKFSHDFTPSTKSKVSMLSNISFGCSVSCALQLYCYTVICVVSFCMGSHQSVLSPICRMLHTNSTHLKKEKKNMSTFCSYTYSIFQQRFHFELEQDGKQNAPTDAYN